MHDRGPAPKPRRARHLALLLEIVCLALFAASGAYAQQSGHVVADDGVKLFYRTFGAGRSLVIVPLVSWNVDEFERRAERHRFVFYDPRGRGGSDTVEPDAVGLERDLADLEAVRRHFGRERVTLVGSSYYGGLVALYAARYPQHVKRLVMVGPISLRRESFDGYDLPQRAERSTEDDQARLADLERRGAGPQELCRAYWGIHRRQLVGDPQRVSDVGLTERCNNANEWPENFHRWVGGLLEDLGQWDWTAEAAKVKAPALIIQGGRDLIVPPQGAEAWAATMRRARLLVLERAGHVPWLGMPEAIFPETFRFLAGRWPAGARKVRSQPTATAR